MNKDKMYNLDEYLQYKELLKYYIDEKTSEEKLDEIPLSDIERYLRKKKLENIKK